jgi:glycosyltransferase involved in cell wall biosynthesis
MKPPLVSISCITYNHAPFIRECLDGFLMQQTNFPFEILIHDDASTDGTKEIIEEYTVRYPNLIFPIFQTENQYSKGVRGMMPKFNFPRARGKYIALCEGDDYWTDPLKLQKQVDYLEANPEYSICFHPVQVLNNGVFEKDELRKVGETTTINDLAKGNYIHTPSVVFRNGLFDHNAPIFKKIPAGDYLVHMLNSKKGLIKKLDEPMAVYRKHDQGIWSKTNNITIAKKWILQMDLMMAQFIDFPEVHASLEKQRKNCVKAIRRSRTLIRFLIRIKDSLIYRLNLNRNANIHKQ